MSRTELVIGHSLNFRRLEEDAPQKSSIGVVDTSRPFSLRGSWHVTPLMAYERIQATKSVLPNSQVQLIPVVGDKAVFCVNRS